MSAPVEIGFFSFTEITDPSEHRSYNEWHQLDHLPQQYELPGVVHGQRWVSSPECKQARIRDTEQMAPVDYVTLYLMSAPVDSTLEAFKALGKTLHEAARFHEHRRARLSGPFAVSDARAAPRVLVSAEVVPFRPNLGVYVVVETSSGDDTSQKPQAGEDAVPRAVAAGVVDELLAVPGVAGVWRFVSLGGFERLGWHPGERRVTVCYLDQPPLVVATRLGEVVLGGPALASLEFAGPFETVTPWEWDWFNPPRRRIGGAGGA